MKTIELKDRELTLHFTTDKEVYKSLTKNDSGDSLGTAWYKDKVIVIGVYDGKLKTLVHELYHAMGFINIRLGEADSICFSEANAWLMEYLFDQLREELV